MRCRHFSLFAEQVDNEQKREEKFVLLEERPTNIDVQRVRKVLGEVGEPLVNVFNCWCILDG